MSFFLGVGGGGGMAGEVDFFFGKTWGSKSWISCCPSYQFMRVKLPFVSNWYQNSALVVVDFKSPTCQRKRDRHWNWGWKMPGVDFGVGKLLFFFGGGKPKMKLNSGINTRSYEIQQGGRWIWKHRCHSQKRRAWSQEWRWMVPMIVLFKGWGDFQVPFWFWEGIKF